MSSLVSVAGAASSRMHAGAVLDPTAPARQFLLEWNVLGFVRARVLVC